MDGDVFWNRGLNAVNPCGAYCCAAPLRLGQLQDRNLRRHIYSRLICTVWQNRGGRRTKPSKTVQKGSRGQMRRTGMERRMPLLDSRVDLRCDLWPPSMGARLT